MSICYTIIQPAIKKFEWNNGLIQKSTHPFYCNSSLESWWAPWSELLIRTDNPRRAGVKLGLETLWHLSEDGLFSAVCGRMVMGMMLACVRARARHLSPTIISCWFQLTNHEQRALAADGADLRIPLTPTRGWATAHLPRADTHWGGQKFNKTRLKDQRDVGLFSRRSSLGSGSKSGAASIAPPPSLIGQRLKKKARTPIT